MPPPVSQAEKMRAKAVGSANRKRNVCGDPKCIYLKRDGTEKTERGFFLPE
jgi:hypothetical protein